MDLIKKKNLNTAFYSDEALFTELIFPDSVCAEPAVNPTAQAGSKAFQVVLPQCFPYGEKNADAHKRHHEDRGSCS